jgi:class 3 adenylate cyclase/tetratricopeptide (TPR) repeat protein/TolB-like protein
MARDQRRLAAIVSADVAGYSRLMGEDESRTLAALKAHRRELIDPKIAEYGGRIVKTTGDGLLLEFPSVVEAVRCAVDVQRGIVVRNAEVPADQRIEFRIGINVGDIIIDDEDIYGDGVNVAARLQALAEPGEICVSKAVRDQVLDKLSFGFEELGAQQVKNIARPVEAYRVELESDSPMRRTRVASQRRPAARAAVVAAIVSVVAVGATLLWWGSHRDVTPAPPTASVGVMPLVAPTGDVAMGQRADTLTRDLISILPGSNTLIRVVPGPVGQTVEGGGEIRAMARSLNVRYLLQGQVRPGADVTLVVLRLMDGLTGEQLGSETISIKPADTTIEPMKAPVGHLRGTMFDVETRRVMAQPRGDATAADYVLLASSLNRTEPDTLHRAQEQQKLLEEALRRDPNLVPALLGLSGVLESQLYDDMHADRARLVARLDEVTRRAVNLKPAHPRVLLARARALALLGHWDSALEAITLVTRLDPNSADALIQRAWLMSNMGRPGEALKLAEQAIALDPADSGSIEMVCDAHVLLGEYEQAIAACERVRAFSVNERWPYYDLLAAYTQLGDKAKAENALKDVLRVAPDVTISGLKNTDSTNADYLRLAEKHFYSALRRAGIPEQ